MKTALLISTILHSILLLGFNGNYKIPESKPVQLEVKFINREQDVNMYIPKKVHGFGEAEGQADTFQPDDSCAWSMDLQKQLLEE